MKKLIMMAAVALAGVAMAGCPEGPKCEGPRPGCEKKCRGPKPVMLVLDKDLCPDKVEAYKAEVAAAIDEIVRKHQEFVANLPEPPQGEACDKRPCPPAPRIVLNVDFGCMMGPKGPRGPRGMKCGPRPECGRGECGPKPGCECGPKPECERAPKPGCECGECGRGECPPPPPSPAPEAAVEAEPAE